MSIKEERKGRGVTLFPSSGELFVSRILQRSMRRHGSDGAVDRTAHSSPTSKALDQDLLRHQGHYLRPSRFTRDCIVASVLGKRKDTTRVPPRAKESTAKEGLGDGGAPKSNSIEPPEQSPDKKQRAHRPTTPTGELKGEVRQMRQQTRALKARTSAKRGEYQSNATAMRKDNRRSVRLD